jgi:hypothetical protein
MKRAVLIFGTLLAGAWCMGCGPTETFCADVESAASQHVLEAIGSDQPCTVDEDCEVVAVNGSCFDVCSRVIATENREAFEQALDEAEDDHCVDYDGCTLIIPPCAPPDAAVCGASGLCEGG